MCWPAGLLPAELAAELAGNRLCVGSLVFLEGFHRISATIYADQNVVFTLRRHPAHVVETHATLPTPVAAVDRHPGNICR
jgi:hypothetical protein